MLAYNIICVILSIACSWYLFYGVYVAGTMYGYVETAEMTYGALLYTVSKNVELLDTVFMVFRHKWGQISYLHMFHHSSILLLGNYTYSHVAYPPLCIPIALNSVVHIYLYWYYAYTSMFGSVSLFWKRGLTQFQIIQFLFDIVFTIYGYIYYTVCKYAIMYAASMLVMFSNFYYMAYIRKRPTDTSKKIE